MVFHTAHRTTGTPDQFSCFNVLFLSNSIDNDSQSIPEGEDAMQAPGRLRRWHRNTPVRSGHAARDHASRLCRGGSARHPAAAGPPRAPRDSEAFVSARQLHDELRAGGDKIGLATIYRTLQAMLESGEVDAVRADDGETLSRKCGPRHHHHLVCRNCGLTVELDGPSVERWAARRATTTASPTSSTSSRLFGLCAKCPVGRRGALSVGRARRQDATPLDPAVQPRRAVTARPHSRPVPLRPPAHRRCIPHLVHGVRRDGGAVPSPSSSAASSCPP